MSELPPPPGPAPHVSAPLLKRMHPYLFVLFALAVVFILYQLIAGGLTLIIAGGVITPANVGLVRWSTLIGQLVFILLPTIILARLRYGAIAHPLRIRLPRPTQLFLVLVAVFSLQQVLQGYMVLQDAIPLPPVVQQWVDMIKEMFEATYRMLVSAKDPWELLGVLATVAVVPAIAEELLFRGLIQHELESSLGGLRGAAIAGTVFALYHMNPFSLVPLVALGVFFGFVVYRSGTVMLAVAAHFLNNFLASLALYLHVDDDFIVSAPGGGADALTLAFNTAVFALVFVAATSYFVHITRLQEPDRKTL